MNITLSCTIISVLTASVTSIVIFFVNWIIDKIKENNKTIEVLEGEFKKASNIFASYNKNYIELILKEVDNETNYVFLNKYKEQKTEKEKETKLFLALKEQISISHQLNYQLNMISWMVNIKYNALYVHFFNKKINLNFNNWITCKKCNNKINLIFEINNLYNELDQINLNVHDINSEYLKKVEILDNKIDNVISWLQFGILKNGKKTLLVLVSFLNWLISIL